MIKSWNFKEHQGTRVERKPWDSKHWHRILTRKYIVDQRQVLKIWEVCDQPNRPENLDVEQKRPVYFAK